MVLGSWIWVWPRTCSNSSFLTFLEHFKNKTPPPSKTQTKNVSVNLGPASSLNPATFLPFVNWTFSKKKNNRKKILPDKIFTCEPNHESLTSSTKRNRASSFRLVVFDEAFKVPSWLEAFCHVTTVHVLLRTSFSTHWDEDVNAALARGSVGEPVFPKVWRTETDVKSCDDFVCLFELYLLT